MTTQIIGKIDKKVSKIFKMHTYKRRNRFLQNIIFILIFKMHTYKRRNRFLQNIIMETIKLLLTKVKNIDK